MLGWRPVRRKLPAGHLRTMGVAALYGLEGGAAHFREIKTTPSSSAIVNVLPIIEPMAILPDR